MNMMADLAHVRSGRVLHEKMRIAGKAVGGDRVIEVMNPYTGTLVGTVPKATLDDVRRAFWIAKRFKSRLTRYDRYKICSRAAELIRNRSEEISDLITAECGICKKDSLHEVGRACDVFVFAGNAALIDDGQIFSCDLTPHGKQRKVYTMREPLQGAISAITPFNHPLNQVAHKVAPSIATNNRMVLKPAEKTPLTALLLAEICEDADLPPGVVNVVTGDGRTGAALVAHPGVDKIAFTGSTEVGKIIQKTVAGTRKHLTLELGGKAANIVFADAPLDQAIEGVVNGIYFNQGHVCCAGSRLLVQESVHDEVVAKLAARIETLRLGDPLDKNTDIGAINSAAQHAKISELVESGVAEGAVLYQQSCALPERGYFHRAAFFTGVSQSHRIAREEIFGPILSIMTFRTADEAIEKANNTPYGLSAGVWTDKGAKSMYVAQRLEAGVVWCSTFNQFDPSSPFGGYRESGFGREGGVAGLRSYLSV
ncbi:MAG: aldehyde dehydrogenase family protein [Pseudomonadota bacterium]|nr:aldehyde dehydrogenase family protein [Pseudomonadota bacterium]